MVTEEKRILTKQFKIEDKATDDDDVRHESYDNDSHVFIR